MKGLLVNALLLTALPILLAAEPAKYVCPPCDMPCDAHVFDQPGRCPAC